jgi:hypothetical protein
MKITTNANRDTMAPIASQPIVSPGCVDTDGRKVTVQVGDLAVTLTRGEVHRLFDAVEGERPQDDRLFIRPA